MATDWEAVRQQGGRLRAYEVWLASPEGQKALEPTERIKRLETGNEKLRRKLEKRKRRV